MTKTLFGTALAIASVGALAGPALAGTIVVNTKDDGSGANNHMNDEITLREAIELANGSRSPTSSETGSGQITGTVGAGMADTIDFDAGEFLAMDSGGIPTTISVTGSDLPALTDSHTTINGDGRVRLADPGGRNCGLTFRSTNCTVSGVRTVDFNLAGFCLNPGDQLTKGNTLLDCSGYRNNVGVLVSGANAQDNVISSKSTGVPGTTTPFCQFGSPGEGQTEDGVRIDNLASGTTVDHCDIRDNGAGGPIGAGVYVTGGATGTTIGPLDVLDDNDYGVQVDGAGGTTTITSNVIGTEPADHGVGRSNDGGGIRIEGGPGTGVVNGNLILWNRVDGIALIDGAAGWTVEGNTVGATQEVGGGSGDGISLYVTSGGATAPKNIEVKNNFVGFEMGTGGPVNRGNEDNGILVDANGTGVSIHDNDVRRNVRAGVRLGGGSIPLTVKDNQVSENGEQGVLLQSTGFGPLAGGQTVTGNNVHDNTFSGISFEGGGGSGSTVSGNTSNRNMTFGIRLGSTTTGVTVSGNYAGTDASGAKAGNGESGILVMGPGNTIVGNTAGDNSVGGILLAGGTASGNAVKGNSCGRNGAFTVGNGEAGIVLEDGAQDNTIGGTGTGNDVRGNPRGIYLRTGGGAPPHDNTIGPDNLVTGNGGNGVEVSGGGVTSNTVTRNSIFSNVGVGIRLAMGGNSMIPKPVITGVSGDRSAAVIAGTIDAITSLPATVELFTDGADEGETYFAQVTVPSGSPMVGGKYLWAYTGSVAATGANVTATVTSNAGNTSEFSDPVEGPIAAPEPGPEPTDAGTDLGTDLGTDAGSDAGTDAGSDAGSDTGTDTGVPPVDMMPDANVAEPMPDGPVADLPPADVAPDLPPVDGPPADGPAGDGTTGDGTTGDGTGGDDSVADGSGGDGGVSDAGDDAGGDGASTGDGGTGTDGGSGSDGSGKQDGPGLADAGPKPGQSAGGCDCRMGDGPGAGNAALLAASVLALCITRRGRRGRNRSKLTRDT